MLVYDATVVVPFVLDRIEGLRYTEDMVGIGLERDNAIVAAVVYEGFNGRNVWMHSAVDFGGIHVTREFVRAAFVYPFEVCKVDRVSGYVNESNTAARRLDEHLGFREEARLKGAAPDGGDVIIYVMWREACRYA